MPHIAVAILFLYPVFDIIKILIILAIYITKGGVVMRALSSVLVVLGAVLFVYAIAGRFINGPTVMGYVMALDPKTLVMGANTFILLGIAGMLMEKK